MSLQLLNIYKSYGSKKHRQIVLNNLSITFPTKTMIGIIGSSGKGKSTILNIIAGIEKVDKGIVKVDQREMKTNQEITNYRRQYISFLYQYYNMIDALTMKENILLAANSKQNVFLKIEETMVNYAQRLEVEHLLTRYPKELSGGQLQRMALIRAFICNAPILLADEPTGALNQENGEKVMQELRQYAKSHLVIVVSHDTALLKQYTKNIIDLDTQQREYHFMEETKYELYQPIKSIYSKALLKWQYVFKQLLYNKNKLLLIITSQIFTIITSIMLISAYGGIHQYLDNMYYQNPSKNYIEIQKTDYTKPIIKENEYALLQNDMIEQIQYAIDLSVGKLQYKETVCNNEYIVLPKNREHIKIVKGVLPSNNNMICVNESFINAYSMSINDALEYTFDNQKYTFLISGIIKDTMRSSNAIYIEKSYLDTKLVEKVSVKDHVVVELKETNDSQKYIKNIDQKVFYGYSIHLDIKEGYQSLIELGSFVAVIFIIVSFIISMILIMIILSTMMYERRKNSALLLVYGLTKIELLNLFIKENCLIAIIISILGSACSWIVISLINVFDAFAFLTTISPLFKLPGISIYYVISSIYLISCLVLTLFSITKIFKMNISLVLKEE